MQKKKKIVLQRYLNIYQYIQIISNTKLMTTSKDSTPLHRVEKKEEER